MNGTANLTQTDVALEKHHEVSAGNDADVKTSSDRLFYNTAARGTSPETAV